MSEREEKKEIYRTNDEIMTRYLLRKKKISRELERPDRLTEMGGGGEGE